MGRQECHAWFGGSGAVAAIVATLNLREDWAAAELVPLAAAALANLATPPAAQEQSQGSEASTSPVQCILANTYVNCLCTCAIVLYTGWSGSWLIAMDVIAYYCLID